jgi:aldehyde:ferredoxin oxidoreductase
MNPIKGGYSGRLLFVDLNEGTLEKVPLDETFARTYVGGAGFCSKILFDRIRPGSDPLGPDNVLMLGAGPLTGTLFPQASRYIVAAKSPITDGWGESHSGGFFGPELKLAGYDGVVISGRAENPVYLWIEDDEAEIRDAAHLWGQFTFDAIETVLAECREPEAEAVAIGPAGENLVRIASLLTRNGRVSARAGMGAVMGSKNLKAVAVRGTRGLDVARPGEYLDAVRIWYDKVLNHPFTEGRIRYGTSELIDLMNAIGRLPTYNMRQGVYENGEKLGSAEYRKKFLVRPRADFSCLQRCGRFVRVASGPYKTLGKGPEFECISALGSRCGNPHLDSIMHIHHLCDEYGMDTIGVGSAVAWAMECFERGILNQDDTGGLELRWGDADLIVKLTGMIGRREGFGDLLADGTYRAAEKIGRGSGAYVMHVKKADIAGQEPRGQKSMGLASATSARGADHLYAFPVLDEGSVFEREIREWYGEEKLPEIGDRLSPKHKGYMVYHNENYAALIESLGVCKYGTMVPPALYYEDIIRALEVTVGWTADEKELKRIGERIVNLNRLFNVREGLGRSDDSLPDRLTREKAPLGPPAGQVVELDAMLDEYYNYRGWDPETGRPAADTLKRLGLEGEGKGIVS